MMKITEADALEITNKLAADFADLLKGYLFKMGLRVVPEFTLRPIPAWKNPLTMNEIVKIANEEIGENKAYPKGVKTKSRKRYLVIRRQTCGYVGTKMGFGCEIVGNALGIDHATILHGNHVIADKLQIKDREVTEVYNKLTYLFNTYYTGKNGEDLSKA